MSVDRQDRRPPTEVAAPDVEAGGRPRGSNHRAPGGPEDGALLLEQQLESLVGVALSARALEHLSAELHDQRTSIKENPA